MTLDDGTMFDDVLIRPEHITPARLATCAHAHDETEAATFLDMLGIGTELAWNAGGGL